MQIDLRYQNFLSLLDAVFSLYRRNFTLFFWITAAFLLIPNLALQIVSVHVFGASDLLGRMGDMLKLVDPAQVDKFNVEEMERFKNIGLYVLPVNVLVMVLKAMWYGVLINTIHRNAIGSGCGFTEAFRIGRRKYLRLILGMIVLSVLGGIVISPLLIGMLVAIGMGGSLTCISMAACALIAFVMAVGIFGGILLTVFYPVIVTEERGPIEALIRSARLIWGSWWRAFGIVTVIMVIINIIYTISEFGFTTLNSVAVSLNPGYEIFGDTVFATGMALVQIFTLPIIVIAQTVLLYDLKTRREAYDLEVMIKGF